MSNFIKIYFRLILVVGMLPSICLSQICSNSGDLIVYSNYNGGVLNINVDQNIPNLKIGVSSYEATQINIFGTFASNVVGVIYAGFNASNNTSCPPNTIPTTTVSGVSPSSFTIYSNTTGNQAMANYLGEELFFSTNIPIANCIVGADGVCGVGSGGANSSGQIVQFFLSEFGPGTSLFSHSNQYSCFTGTYNVSSGGNCCAQTPTSAINPIYQGGSNYNFIVPTVTTLCNGSITIDLSNYPVLFQPPTYPGYIWSNGATGPIVTFSTPGVYSFYVGDYCHYDSTTFLRDTITILPCCNSATVQSIQTLTTVCGLSTGAATINTSPASNSYTWSSGIGSTTNIATGLAAGNYTVIFGLNNCTTSAVVTITNSPPPSITSVQTTTTICGLSTGAATVNTTPANNVYAWSSGVGSITNTASGLMAGNYSVTASLGGCSVSTVITIASGGPPSIASVQTTTTICGLSTGAATINTSPASNSYTWSSGIGSTTNIATGLAAGNYTVIFGLNNCTASAVVTITNSPPPSITSVQTTTTICGLSTGAATVNTTPANNVYAWSSGVGSITNTASGLMAGNYSVTASLGGCSVSTVITIVSGGPPSIASVQTTTTICGLSTGAATVNTNPVSTTYSWSSGVSSTTNTSSGLAVGNYTVTASLNGCEVSTVVTIISGGPPSITSVQTTTTICGLATGAATVNTNPVSTIYSWSSGVSSTTNNASGLPVGNYNVTASLHGCSVSTVITIVSGGPPNIATVQTTTTICGLATGSATVNTIPVCNFYLWSSGFSSTTNTINGLAAGNYTVTASLYGCSVSTVIAISSGNPPSVSSVQTSTSACNLATGAATVNTSPLCDTYIWSSGINSTTNSATAIAAGNYTVIASLYGCSVSTVITIKNPQFPPISSVQTRTTSFSCSELCASFSLNTAQNPNYTYSWVFTSPLLTSVINSSLYNPEVCFNQAGNYQANVSITDNYGCRTSENYFNVVTVDQKPLADFNFSPDKPNVLANPVVDFNNLSKWAADYSWYNVNNLFSKEANPAFEFTVSGDYLITLIAKNGKCSDTITKNISVLEDFFMYVPDAFSPNGDGLNDYFYPVLTGNLSAKSYRFELFNKWGTSLYSSTNPNETKWDGYYKNDLCANDIYQWKIRIIRNGFKSIEKTGHVLIIK